jgi:bis(5'-nucleosyl)-tetraphosphatase (symmetrical)
LSTYAIGDVHGADHLLRDLLNTLDARGNVDAFWFVGDLVNRGPDSLGVLRRVRALGDRAVTVLGNHDLSLLSLADQPDAIGRAPESLKPLLRAHDCAELLDWLRHRPLIHRDTQLGWTMVHAGIPTAWSVDEAIDHAGELEQALRGAEHHQLLTHLFGNTPSRWKPSLTGMKRLRFIANALTRQRFVTVTGALDMEYKKTIANAPKPLMPWFLHPQRASACEHIVFGHWSALEHVEWPEHHVWGIDTGAAWNGTLSALQLDAQPPVLTSVPPLGGEQ